MIETSLVQGGLELVFPRSGNQACGRDTWLASRSLRARIARLFGFHLHRRQFGHRTVLTDLLEAPGMGRERLRS